MATLQITFVSESAGYQNTLGWYNKRTGEAGIVFRNANDDGPHAAISAGTAATVDVAQSDIDAGNVGFFVIANGAAIYGTGSSSVLAGPLSFSTKPNGDGVIRDAAGHKLAGEQGEIIFTDKVLNKHNVDYTSDGSGANGAAVNADQADGITGRIAFEDLVRHSDRDFNDLVIDVQTVGPVNQPPVVDDQVFSIAENSAAGAVVGQVAASDPDAGQSLSYAIIGGNANGAFAIDAVTGAVSVADPSKLDFENPSLNGYALTVKVTDSGTGALTDTAVVTISVTDINEAPVAGSDTLAVEATEDFELVILASSLLANDTDPDAGATQSIVAVGGATHGAVSLNGDGDVVFVPADDYSGPASFTYTMSDGALTSTATVSLNVAAAADAPTLVVADASSTGDAAIALSVAAALGDLDGSESLAIEISGVPAGWTLSAGTVDPDTGAYLLTASDLGGLTLTPPPGTIDSIALTITARATEASNGDSASSSGILTVSVANGTPGNDVLVGGPGDDVIDALAGNDLIVGLGGNDVLFGSEGNDTLRGGAGDDLLDGGVLADFQSQAGFADTDTADYSAAGSAVSVNLATGTAADGDGGTDTLTGIERVVGSAFDDVLTGSGAFSERYVGGAGNDTIDGGLFNDRAEYANATAGITANMTALGAGSGTVTGDVSVGTDTLVGVEQILGTSHADTYVATGYLSPSSPGGVMSNFNEFEGRGGNDTITGNGGTRLSFQGAFEAVNVNLATGIAVGGASVGTDTFTGVNMVRGSAFSDTLAGGLAANNNFESFEGLGGNDTINGGFGFDRADYAFDGATSTGITVNLAAGTVSGDPVLTGTDTLQSIESVRGSFRDDSYNAVGFSGASANAGSNGSFNEFEGMAGNDSFTGNGNTRLSYVSAREAVNVNLGSGIATGGASVGTDSFTGVNAARGSNFDDTLTGSNNGVATAEVFEARAGDDTIDGGGGFDLASYASDPATAGISVNMAAVNAFTGTVSGDVTIGTDTLIDVVSVRGTGFADSYVATGYNSVASGLGTFNEFEGGGGNDSITGNGNTRITFVNAGSGVSVDLGAGTASGATTGNDTLSGVNAVRGSNFSDSMIGSGNAESFEGRGGNDTIDGLGGIDLVRYERDPTGPGTFIQNSAGVITATVVNQGVDTLSNIEAIRATNFADTLDASAYAGGIQFEALNGDDSMAGGGGNDTLNGGAGTDVVSYAGATAGVTVDLAAGTASDGMGGSDTLISIENAIGSAFNDTLGGSADNNQLQGGAGADRLIGGAGNDVLDGGVIADFQSTAGFIDVDTVDYGAAAGAVNVNLAAGTATDGQGGSDTLIGIERIVGSAFDDVFTGSGAFVERYFGGAGNDTIDGGLFNDRAEYGGATAGITVNMTALGAASGTVTGDASVGTDTLIGVEQVNGTDFADTYTALGYLSPSAPGGVSSNFNEFEGAGGNDSISGNGGTRISYQNALEAVNVNLVAGVAVGGASVGTDSFTGVNQVRGSSFADTLTGGLAANNNFESFEGRGGNDVISGGAGFDRADYTFDGAVSTGITVNLAAGTVSGDAALTGTDTLLSIESVRGSYLGDSYSAIGFSGSSANAGSNGTFNEFEGMAGNDLITGNGNTRVTYSSAREAVNVNLATGTATGGASVGTDLFTGVNAARGSNFDDTLIGSIGNDSLLGGAGNDVLSGGNGNDLLEAGDGIDMLTGGIGIDILRSSGSGTDTFDYNQIGESGDIVEQFSAGAGGDVFDIADLLDASTSYADGAGGALSDYVRVATAGANGLLQIDTDGMGAGSWQTLANILGGSALDLNTLLAGGNIDYFN